MRHVTEYSKQELNDMLKELTIQFQEAKKLNLKLNMARGKPAAAQLDMNMGLLEFPEGCTLEDGTDARNYGVLEGIPEKLAAIITKKVHIPTIGIGASAECDGQVLVYQDMLAMYGNFVPKFVKQFAQVGEVMQGAVKDYINAVKEGTFPGPENAYAISDDVIEKLY